MSSNNPITAGANNPETQNVLSTTLEDQLVIKGQPNYQTVVVGNQSPVNQTLDPDPDRAVSQLVLETCGIPFNQPILGGSLPGYDIRNQDATSMLRLSLSTELLTDPPPGSARVGPGGFAEVELDPDGIARFYIVGADLTGSLPTNQIDIRYCIPTGQLVNGANMVIVRGYDPPITRELRDSFDGLKNKEIMNYADCAEETCEQPQNDKFATISYDDPALDQSYNDDIINSYEIKAFESLLGYIVDFDAPEDTEGAVRISFGDTTKEYIKFPVSTFKRSIVDGTIPAEADLDTSGFQQGGSITAGYGGSGFGASIADITRTNADGTCETSTTTLVGGTIILPASRFLRLNKFGENESDFLGVQDILFSGQKVFQVSEFAGGGPGFGGAGYAKSILNTNKELIQLQHGRNWTWTTSPGTDGEDVIINLFYLIDSEYTKVISQFYFAQPAAYPGFKWYEVTKDVQNTPNDQLENTPADISSAGFQDYIAGIGDSLGYKALNGEMCVVVERRRPSIDVYDPRGNALSIANQIALTYTPIVLVDCPAPIAYASNQTTLSSIDETTGGNGRIIDGTGIIDQTDGIRDSDPSTTQDFDESELSILQDNVNGTTIDITLPFLDEQECLDVAQTFLAEQTETVNSTSVVLGPDSSPRLGDTFTDSSGNTAIINEINYSYQDGSQYLITATTGPKYLTAGSFNSSQYQLQTEDVTKEGLIIQDYGDGATYVVRIRGGDEITALSFVLADISVGDKCQVKIFNNPVEHI